MASPTLIYKIVPRSLWHADAAEFSGAPIDHADGYIHFSTAAQAQETAMKHFRHQADLLLVHVDATLLGEALRWEVSRGGALFPHLYGPLPLSAVVKTELLALDGDGVPLLPHLA